MENVKTGKEKQLVYSTECARLKKAIKSQFYLEAVAISYAIIEDRLIAFLFYAGMVSLKGSEPRVNKAVYPYIRRLMNKDDDYIIKIKNISVKASLINAMLEMTESDAREIDESVKTYIEDTLKRKKSVARPGYMLDLFLQINGLDRAGLLKTFKELEQWRMERNDLIHALMRNTVDTASISKRDCADKGDAIFREIDNKLVKPFKKHNLLRKKYNIQ